MNSYIWKAGINLSCSQRRSCLCNFSPFGSNNTSPRKFKGPEGNSCKRAHLTKPRGRAWKPTGSVLKSTESNKSEKWSTTYFCWKDQNDFPQEKKNTTHLWVKLYPKPLHILDTGNNTFTISVIRRAPQPLLHILCVIHWCIYFLIVYNAVIFCIISFTARTVREEPWQHNFLWD